MIECAAIVGKTISHCFIYEEGSEIRLQFDDGTEFSARLKTSVEAQHTRDDGGEPVVLNDYTPPSS